MNRKFLVIIEETSTGYSAYCPDLPGCAATGNTKEEVEALMQQSIKFHLEGLSKEGLEIPSPRTYSSYYELDAA